MTSTTSGASTALCVIVCVCVCVVGRAVHLCKQAACYFLAPALPATLEALSEAPPCHFKVVRKRKVRKVISVCKRGRFFLPHLNYTFECECQCTERNGCLSLCVCLQVHTTIKADLVSLTCASPWTTA